jgi:hypothetical protein
MSKSAFAPPAALGEIEIHLPLSPKADLIRGMSEKAQKRKSVSDATMMVKG